MIVPDDWLATCTNSPTCESVSLSSNTASLLTNIQSCSASEELSATDNVVALIAALDVSAIFAASVPAAVTQGTESAPPL